MPRTHRKQHDTMEAGGTSGHPRALEGNYENEIIVAPQSLNSSDPLHLHLINSANYW